MAGEDFIVGNTLLSLISPRPSSASTASYQAKNLQGIGLSSNDLTGWDFSGQNLTNADLGASTLTNANLSGANLTNATLFLDADP